MSSWRMLMPSAGSCSMVDRLRAVAMTRSPRAIMECANCRPKPDEQPVTSQTRGAILVSEWCLVVQTSKGRLNFLERRSVHLYHRLRPSASHAFYIGAKPASMRVKQQLRTIHGPKSVNLCPCFGGFVSPFAIVPMMCCYIANISTRSLRMKPGYDSIRLIIQ